MKIFLSSVILLCWSLQTNARDPFSPPGSASCLKMDRIFEDWKLVGIIGRDEQFTGWLRFKDEKALNRVTANDPYPFSGWKIERIKPFQLSFKVSVRAPIREQIIPTCQGHRIVMEMKGNKHVKNRAKKMDKRTVIPHINHGGK